MPVPAIDVAAIAPLTDVSDWLRSSGLKIVLLLLGAVLITRFAGWLRDRITDRIDSTFRHTDALIRTEDAKYRHALAQVLTWVLLSVVYIAIGVEVIRCLGFNLAGLIAPAAVFGAALGFGGQRVVQDLVAGFFLITERQYGFGDVVRIDATGVSAPADGIVEDLTLRITKLRSSDGEVISVPNGQIAMVTNLSKDWARAVVDVPVAAAVDTNRVNEVLQEVCAKAYQDRRIRPLLLDEPSVMGVESLEVDQVNIRVVARTLPGKQFEVRRELRARIVAALRRDGLIAEASSAASSPAADEQ
ncbi:mechanosensitive ion channel family protein [Skermania piniformis]|uniref:Mechanosensitive ion channel family protein n=1 Tax=Skermania pinensis TaxID=39122 RepID=A0ABX8S4R1_9ACTN|nr:mechanosensitive ion channel family protein [Skermania piniformis]QXQ12834.1 mechanosensitive ion channel family protein [Skermania piniformis]